MYTAYVLTEEARKRLERLVPPKYSEFIGHHVTEQFGVPAGTPVPEMPVVRLVGVSDSEDGLQALVVSVNDTVRRPDGKSYHITWSLDRDKYKPVDSNTVIMEKGHNFIKGIIHVDVVPQLLG